MSPVAQYREEERATSAADLAIEAGALMLSSGAAAAEVVRAMLAVTQHSDIAHVMVDVTYSELAFSYQSREGIPYTRIHTIWGRTFHYGKLTLVTDVVQRFCQGQITLDEAKAEVRTLANSSGPYPGWLTRLAAGFAGANAALVFGGGWLVMLAAFAANLVLDYLVDMLTQRNWFSFYMQALSGCIAVFVAVIVHTIDPTIDPSLVVVAVIIVMLAGMTSTSGVQDAITGWYLTAVGRIFEAVMNTVGLLVGVALGLLVAERLAVDLRVTSNVPTSSLPLPVIVLASALVAVGFSLVSQNAPRTIVPTAVLAMIGYTIFHLADTAHLGTEWASAAAAFVVGLAAIPCTQWFKAPAAAFAISALLPLFPGLKLFQGLSAFAQSSVDGITILITALGIALALAGGLTFGQYLGIATWRKVRPVENPFFAPLFAKPFAADARGSGDRGGKVSE